MSKFHTRILEFPFAQTIAGARLVDLTEQKRGQRLDLIMDYRELAVKTPPELMSSDGMPVERVEGVFIPRRLRFVDISWVKRSDMYQNLAGVPADHPCRELRSMLLWLSIGADRPFYLLSNSAPDIADLSFFARGCKEEAVPEALNSPPEAVNLTRNWSPPPPSPARLVPAPQKLHTRFGGDPVTIWLNGRVFHRRLFVGGVEQQEKDRPQVDVVLNLGEYPSRWLTPGFVCPDSDRWENKGEGRVGMTPAEIASEARWVIERLKAGKTVLVHCYAGMNRSSTVCCAVLILLEGLSAEEALERVRQHHPWARPDSHHWLALRWLAKETRLKRAV